MANLNKYYGIAEHRGQPIYWGLASKHGLPFRGKVIMVRNEEEPHLLYSAQDFHHQLFDLSVPEDFEAYGQVMDRIANKWYTLVSRTPMVNGEYKHYVEWIENFLESRKIR